MCGIGGYFSWGGVPYGKIDPIAKALDLLEMRGRDATGVAYTGPPALGSGIWAVNKGPIKASMYEVPPEMEHATMFLLHTRAATQGPAQNNANNHPVVANGWIVTHNGVIMNDNHLVPNFSIDRVDTLALNTVLEGAQTADAMATALERVSGSIALAAVNPELHPGYLLLGRVSRSPLYVVHGDQAITWGSTAEVAGVLARTAGFFGAPAVIEIEDGSVFWLGPDPAQWVHRVVTPPPANDWEEGMYMGGFNFNMDRPRYVHPAWSSQTALPLPARPTRFCAPRPKPATAFLPLTSECHTRTLREVAEGVRTRAVLSTPLCHVTLTYERTADAGFELDLRPHKRIRAWAAGQAHDGWWQDGIAALSADGLLPWERVDCELSDEGAMCPMCGFIAPQVPEDGFCILCGITSNQPVEGVTNAG